MTRPPGRHSGERWRPAWGYGVLALAVVAGAAWLLWDAAPEPAPPAALPMPAQPAASRAPPVDAATSMPSAAPAPASAAALDAPVQPAVRPTDDLAAHVPPGTVPTMKEVIERLHQAGVRTGIGAFNPPGTRPPLIGLAVPDDFELPPGYLRHHQATDDGQRIEAILMFDPDHPPPIAAGRPLATPAERVVPAELAPPGLPIRLISLPAPADPGSTRR